MRILRILLPLLTLLMGSVAAKAQNEGALHTLTTRCIPADAVSGFPKSVDYVVGEFISLSVSGNTGFRFVRWEDEDGVEVSASSSFSYQMPDRDVILTARFVFEPSSPEEPSAPKEKGTVFLQVNPSGAGTINTTSGNKYDVGETINLNTSANSGYRFVNWTKEGEEISDSSSFTYRVEKGEQTLTANYVFNPSSPSEPATPTLAHSLKLVTNPSDATSSLNGEGRYDSGASVHVYGTVNRYYSFVNWTDDEGTVVSETFDFFYSMPDRNVTLTATFSYEFNPESPDEPSSSDIPDREYVAKPRISLYDEEHIQILCETLGSEIHYTLDGSNPSKESPLYEDLIELPGNLTVKAIAFKEGLMDSEIGELEVTHFVLDVPTAEYINRHLHLACRTPGAQMRYSTDDSTPSSEWTLYEGPIPLKEDCTVRFFALKDKYVDSEEGSFDFVYADYMTFGVSAEYGKHFVFLSCEDPAARIHYSIDDEPLTEDSAVYDSPLEMTRSCVVNFMGVSEGLYPSERAHYEFVLDDWQETPPSLSIYYYTRKIAITHPDNLPVKVILDGKEETYETPDTVFVTPGMSLLSATTPATTEDRYDSEAKLQSIVFHKAPILSYDGHSLSSSLADDEEKPDGIREWLCFNGITMLDGVSPRSVEIDDFGRIEACFQSGRAFCSDTTYLNIDYFNTGKVAGIRNGHGLTDTFLTWGDRKEDYSYLRLRGDISAEDLRFVADLPNLATLHLDQETLGEEGYDGVLAGSPIETVFTCSYPDGLFNDMPRLTNVMWGDKERGIPTGLMEETANPNLLLWVPNKRYVPSDVANYVSYILAEGSEPADPDGTGTTGSSSLISLKTGYPFNVHMPLHADRIEVAKEFTQQTEIGVCRGWESIVLPFTPDSIVHEREGRITPFAACEGDIRSLRPFWLYSPTTRGWSAAKGIEALNPYIIQMPNNPEYVEAYNLTGTVTFVADGVELDSSGMIPEMEEWQGGMFLQGSFMPVEDSGVLSLNVNGDDGQLPGSHFTSDCVTLPFGAYVTDAAASSIPVFGDLSSLELPTLFGDGLLIESPAPGVLRICSSRERSVAVTTVTGVTLRTLCLRPGETVTVEDLTRDLYIVGGTKVFVR